MKKFAASFGPSFTEHDAIREKSILWAEMIAAHRWITLDVFRTGVYEITWRHDGGFLPEPKIALDYFRAAKVKVDREAAARELEALERQQTRTALPTPTANGGFQSTPEERRKWAEEDAFIRGYMPGVLARWAEIGIGDVAEPDRSKLAASWAIDKKFASTPNLTPEQRHARDVRIEAEKQAAREYLEEKFGKKSTAVSMLDALTRLQPGDRKTQRVEWADGEVSTVEFVGRFEKPLQERAEDPENKAILKRYDKTPPYNDVDFARDHPDHVEPWPPRPSAADVWPTMRDDTDDEPGKGNDAA